MNIKRRDKVLKQAAIVTSSHHCLTELAFGYTEFRLSNMTAAYKNRARTIKDNMTEGYLKETSKTQEPPGAQTLISEINDIKETLYQTKNILKK